MLELPLDEAQRVRQFGVIQRAARGMDRLIRDLLDVTRIESATFAIRQTRIHPRALLEETLELFDAHARERAVALAFDAAPELPHVVGDRDRLAQLLSNLIGNALKFTPRGGRIRLCACAAGRVVEISVEDSGMGIPPENLPHVFDRFWQADRRSRAGAGLGLGTTFRFTVPCAAAQADLPA